MFLGSLACSGIGIALVGLIDFALVIALIAGVVYQRTYLPGTYGACNDAVDWRNGTDGLNFFVTANQSGVYDGISPHDICYTMVQNTVVAIVVM